MYNITVNQKGTREIGVTETNLRTIERYALFTDLIESHGIITDDTLDKLRMNVRALMDANSNDSDLLDLCSNVLFHRDMKSFGLHQLVTLYLHVTNQ